MTEVIATEAIKRELIPCFGHIARGVEMYVSSARRSPPDASKRILLARVAVASIEAPARYETASQFELTLEQAAVFASVEVDDCQVDVCPDREGF